MAVGYLNERTRKMINMILNRSRELSIKEIAMELSVSTRTVYNELDKANNWLNMKSLPSIQVVRGKVQTFTEKEKNAFESAMQMEQPQGDYIFTPSERIKIIICQIIVSRTPVYVEDLMNICLVSRNTIFSDLQVVIAQLYTYQLGIRYEKKRGYWIDGNPIRIRAIFLLYFNMLEPLLSAGKLSFLCMEEITCYLRRIEKIENELDVHYVQNDMVALAAMIPIMENGNDELYFSDVSIKKVEDSKEYHLIKKYFPELSHMEKIYLTLHFLGGRLASYSKMESDTEENESIVEIAKNLVTEFERRACVVFEHKEGLIRNLYQHIKSSIYRYRFGIQIGNPMAEDIQREYPYIFDIMRVTVKYLEQQIGVQISDSEVAYLSLHFGAYLEQAKHDEKELRILVVCMNGVATGNMISYELKRILPWAKIVGIKAASEIVNPQNICDIIVTSVKIKAVVPVIVVNPILNDFDRKNILNHPLIRSRFGFVDTEALFQLMKKYVLPERHLELKHELEQFFIQQQEEKQPILNPNMWRLTDFLTEDRILFLDKNGRNIEDKAIEKVGSERERRAWERAIYTTASPLLARGSIDERYVQYILERLVEAGPYMFVTKDLILAHARPETGVKHLDISIGIAPDGILFEGEKRARIIFFLVVEDQQKHIGILKDIRKVLAKPEQIDEVVNARNAHAVCEILRSKLSGL
ncbi:MAG: PRD domain-containing protein [Clostridiales bacterium]|nr:PRD domain-containing protein [Clostridiales bacterium]